MLALPVVVLGCASPTEPPLPPGGGHTIELSYAQFGQAVEPVLSRHGCDAGGDCHGGGIRGTLELSPAGAKDTLFDFQQVSLTVSPTDPASSTILLKPLAVGAGGLPHAVKPFATTDDPDYQVILAWVMAGIRR
jgi:hypothetical protein